MIIPKNYSQFYSAGNNFDSGFYIVGSGPGTNSGSANLLKVNNQLQIEYYKLYERISPVVEFTDLIVHDRNIISLLTVDYQLLGSRRAGFTFVDSTGVPRKSLLFNPAGSIQFAVQMLPIQNSKVLFGLFSNAGRLFGVADTVLPGFCSTDTLNLVCNNYSSSPQYNNITLVNSTFNYLRDTAYVHTPKDAQIIYSCSNGPSAPLDTVNYPPIIDVSVAERYLNPENLVRFSVSPNPATNYLIINSDATFKSPIEMRIFNFEGKLLAFKEQSGDVFPIKVDVAEFLEGLYFLCIRTSEGEVHNFKVIVSKD